MDLNRIYNEDCISGIKTKIPDEFVDLIIADPPYFKVIGEKWDYSWRTEEDYIDWSKKWIEEAVRTLRKGGSFYLFGYFRMLCRILPILEASTKAGWPKARFTSCALTPTVRPKLVPSFINPVLRRPPSSSAAPISDAGQAANMPSGDCSKWALMW